MSDWTDERIQQLRELHAAQLSFTVIAARIGGISRNAAIGKARRLGLEMRGQSNPRPRARAPGARVRTPTVRYALSMFKARVNPPAPLPEEISKNPVTLLDLKDDNCRFPINAEGEPFLFCGDEKRWPHSYCSHHCNIAFTYTPNMTERGSQIHSATMRKAVRPTVSTLATLVPEDFAA